MHIVLVLVLALVLAGSAVAGRGDPQTRIRPADQARAKSMLIRAADMNAAFRAIPVAADPTRAYCAALDESDLIVTGLANSPSFTATTEFVVSRSYVYESRADANASWRRGTSAAGQSCVRRDMVAQLRGTSTRLVSFELLPFPRLASRFAAYRIVASRDGVRLYLDLIAMQHSRAEVAIVYGAALTPPPAEEERRLARLVERRAGKAMRGS
jgi:hypothetical protein